MDQRTFDNNVKELAQKLKSSGVVTSDAMARGMAEDILRTEEQMRKQQEPEQKEISEQEETPAQNMVITEALAQAAQAPQKGRLGADVDENTPLSELLEEDASAKITLDTPVVEAGVAKKTVTATPVTSPLDVYESMQEETSEQEDTVQELSSQVTQEQPIPERSTQETADVQEKTSTQEPNAQNVVAEESAQEEQVPISEPEQEEKRPQQPTVDLSEMFNFSKRK